MSYTRYEYLPCVCVGCGMAPEYAGGEYMCDRLFCPSCGKTTRSYFDGYFYALEEWCKMNGTVPEKRAIVE